MLLATDPLSHAPHIHDHHCAACPNAELPDVPPDVAALGRAGATAMDMDSPSASGSSSGDEGGSEEDEGQEAEEERRGRGGAGGVSGRSRGREVQQLLAWLTVRGGLAGGLVGSLAGRCRRLRGACITSCNAMTPTGRRLAGPARDWPPRARAGGGLVHTTSITVHSLAWPMSAPCIIVVQRQSHACRPGSCPAPRPPPSPAPSLTRLPACLPALACLHCATTPPVSTPSAPGWAAAGQ